MFLKLEAPPSLLLEASLRTFSLLCREELVVTYGGKDGMGRDGVGWDGIGWDRKGLYGMVYGMGYGVGLGGVGCDGMALYGMGWGYMG